MSGIGIDDAFNAAFPRFVKADSVNAGQDIDGEWLATEADEGLGIGEIPFVDILKRSANGD